MTLQRLGFCVVSVWMSLAAPAFAGEAGTVVKGSLWFWTRNCPSLDHCETPFSMGERQEIRGELAPPAAPGYISRHIVRKQVGDLRVQLQIMSVWPPDGTPYYLVAQARLDERTAEGYRPVTECTQYHAPSEHPFFPVGACAGFKNREGGGYEELGVTFYKD